MICNPSVSVVMPVYNASPFLKKAIKSILNQTLATFELIIINDASTDNSEKIISSFNDERIVYYKHNNNKGVVAAMNKGVDLARAPYIAVMHADDIALQGRLEKQLKLLEQHLLTAVVAGKSIFIDEEDKEIGSVWKVDDITNTSKEIRKEMIWQNCISHPTVMMRTSIAKQYQYKSSPKLDGFAVEDYPLWLHVLADGYVIEKLPEPVLLYRQHASSATGAHLRKRNPFLVNYYSKQFYLEERKRLNKFSSFDRKVQLTMYLDYIKATLKDIKKRLTT
jgi:glycosyltransferase involved in cell wall biosynthesis